MPWEYYLTWVMLQWGPAEFTTRLPSALWNSLFCVVLAAAGRMIGGWGLAAAVGVLAAVHPFATFFGVEASPYSLMLLGQASLLASALNFLLHPARRWPWGGIVLGGASMLLLLAGYTGWIAFGLTCLGLGLGFVVGEWQRPKQPDRLLRRDFLLLVGATSLPLLVLLPLLNRMLYGPEPAGWMPWDVENVPAKALEYLNIYVLGWSTSHHLSNAGLVLFLLLPAGLISVGRRSLPAAVLLGFALLPFPAAFALMYKQNHWMAERYTSLALPSALLLAVAGLQALARLAALGNPRRAAKILAVAIVLYAYTAFAFRATVPITRTQWEQATDFVATYLQPQDAIIVLQKWHQFELTYYTERIGYLHWPYVWNLRDPLPVPADSMLWMLRPEKETHPPIYWPKVASKDGIAVYALAPERRFPHLFSGPGLLEPGETIALNGSAPELFSGGWSQEQWDGNPMHVLHPQGGGFFLLVHSPLPVRVFLSGIAYPPAVRAGCQITLLINGKPAGSKPLQPDWQTLVWDVPAEALVPGHIQLAFRPDRPVRPVDVEEGSRDDRPLSLWVKDIVVEAAE